MKLKKQPQFEHTKIEKDIDRLSRELEKKRKILRETEEDREEKEILHQIVGEKIKDVPTPASNSSQDDDQITNDGASDNLPEYLDRFQDSKREVNRLVSIAFDKGIEHATGEAKRRDEFVLDAFHDALVDKLYDELKSRKLFD